MWYTPEFRKGISENTDRAIPSAYLTYSSPLPNRTLTSIDLLQAIPYEVKLQEVDSTKYLSDLTLLYAYWLNTIADPVMSGIEVAGLVLGALPVILSGLENFEGAIDQQRSVWKPIRPLTRNTCYLRVCDFSQVEDLAPQVVGSINDHTSIKDDLESLPEQPDETFRLYLMEDSLASVSDLHFHLIDRGFQGGLSPLKGSSKLFEALASQWRALDSTCHQLKMYSFEQVRISDEKYSRGNGGLGFIAGLIRMNMNIQVRDVHGTNNKSIVVIICEFLENPILAPLIEKSKKKRDEARLSKLSEDQWKTAVTQLERFSRNLMLSHHLSKRTFRSLTSRKSLKQLFLLQYYSAILNHYSLFLNAVQREYVSERESMMDPRYSILRPSILKEITADAYVYEELNAIALDLTDPVEGLVSVLGSAFSNADPLQEFRAFSAELHCECTEIRKTASRFSNRLDLHLRFLDVSRNMHESLRVWILSVLASVFLPLSIATGLLSMQTRFIDLNMLLYDFCGVVVLVGSILFLIFHLVRGYVFLKEKLELWRPNSPLTRMAKRVMTDKAGGPTLYCIWGLVLTSLLTGMLKSAQFGGKVLGLGLVVLFPILALIDIGAGVIYWVLMLIRSK